MTAQGDRQADRILEVPEVAEILHLDEQTVRKYFREGTIPGARRLGWKWIIPASSFEAWLYADAN